MVKSIVSILCVIIIILSGALFENDFVKRQFIEINEVLNVLYDKIDEKSATKDDVIAVRKNWTEKKRFLHIFIPHNEIKEFDLWISEAVTLVEDEKWEDAKSKIEVLINLSVEIPKTFTLSIDNVL